MSMPATRMACFLTRRQAGMLCPVHTPNLSFAISYPAKQLREIGQSYTARAGRKQWIVLAQQIVLV